MQRSIGRPVTAAEVEAEIVLRPAQLRDVYSIQSIDRKVFPKSWSQQFTVEQITRRKGAHIVAERAHRVLGHGGVAFLADDAHVTSVAVDPTHHRTGLGTLLMNELIKQSAQRVSGSITLEVRVSNESAIGLYERLGFESAGVRPKYYADTKEDALIMWRSLNDDRMGEQAS